MVKNTNPTTKRKIGSKNGKKVTASDNTPKINTYLSSGAWRIVPMNKTGIANLINTLCTWVNETEDALCFEEFLQLHRLSYQTYYRWVETHPELREAHDYTLMCLGARREKGALKNQLSSTIVLNSMPMHNKRWKDLAEWKSELKNKEDGVGAMGRIVVEIPPYPNSDVVPVKAIEDGQI